MNINNIDFTKLDKEEKIKYLKNLYNKHLIYHNSYFNKFEVKVNEFYKKKENLEKYVHLKFGTVVFFKDFPLYDIDKLSDEDYTFKNHYFVILGKKNDEYYLSYITTKINSFVKNKYKNNNYLILNSEKHKKQILITLRKIYIIKEDFLLEEMHNKTCLINKRLNNIASYYLKLLFLYSDLYNDNFKKVLKGKSKITRNDILSNSILKCCNYSTTSKLNDRTIYGKKELLLLLNSVYSPVKLINL